LRSEYRVVHESDLRRPFGDLETRIVALLLADAAHGHAVIVMRGVDQRPFRQLQQASKQAVILGTAIPVLEIGTTSATDKRRVAGQHTVWQHEAVPAIRVARCIDRLVIDIIQVERLAIAKAGTQTVGYVISPIAVIQPACSRSCPRPVI
jgi:hypothetical protein